MCRLVQQRLGAFPSIGVHRYSALKRSARSISGARRRKFECPGDAIAERTEKKRLPDQVLVGRKHRTGHTGTEATTSWWWRAKLEAVLPPPKPPRNPPPARRDVSATSIPGSTRHAHPQLRHRRVAPSTVWTGRPITTSASASPRDFDRRRLNRTRGPRSAADARRQRGRPVANGTQIRQSSFDR
jgi:hypothetical protein